MAFGRAGAITFLGARFAQHLVTKFLLRRRAGGAQDFYDYFAADHTFPLTESERAAYPALMACIRCGHCDAVCPTLRDGGRPDFAGPQAAVTRFSHSLPHLGLNRAAFECAVCGDCDAVCPTQVPISRMLGMLRAMTAREFPARPA